MIEQPSKPKPKSYTAILIKDLKDIPEYYTGFVILAGKLLLYFDLGVLYEFASHKCSYAFNEAGEEAFDNYIRNTYNKMIKQRNN